MTPLFRQYGQTRSARREIGRRGARLFIALILSIATVGSACEDPPPPIESPCPRVTEAAYVQTLSDSGLPQFWTAAKRSLCLTFHQEVPGTNDLEDSVEDSVSKFRKITQNDIFAFQIWSSKLKIQNFNICIRKYRQF